MALKLPYSQNKERNNQSIQELSVKRNQKSVFASNAR